MGDPGNPNDGGTGAEPDPGQPGWASPTPPPPPPPAAPTPPPAQQPPAPQPATPPTQPQPAATAPAWGATPPAWGTPVPPGGGGWGDTPGPAPKKRRLTWLWLLIPLMLVLVASTTVAIVFGVKLFAAPVDATNDFYAQLRAGNYAEAYSSLCDPARRAFSESDFVAQQQRATDTKGRVTSYDFTDVNFGDDNDFGDEPIDARVNGTVVRGQATYDVRVGLRHEDGDWKVCTAFER